MKHFLFFIFFIALSTKLPAQGLTRYGQITSGSSNDFVDKYGRLGSIPMLDANGKVLFELTTTAVCSLTENTASSGGKVFSVSEITACGVCWNTSPNPLAAGSHTVDGTSAGIFTSTITGLTVNTLYYVRAYATNSYGTGYGNEISFISVPTATNPITGRTWMDRNLGASQVATSSNDAAAYGNLFQWGRAADGHESRTSGITPVLSSSDTPGHGNFISSRIPPDDWRSPQNDNLWQGVSGTNNPCPCGFRLPTYAEWEAECASWSSKNSDGAFASPLKFPRAGARNGDGLLFGEGSMGLYWTSTVSSTNSQSWFITQMEARVFSLTRVYSFSVRCIKD